jgi:geranylgeranyl diphosphate synthase, type I
MPAGTRGDIDELTEGWVSRERLEWSDRLVSPALRLAVDALPGAMRHIAGYHFGWWDEHGRAAGPEPVRAIRSTLALLAAGAVGGDPASAVPAAVGVELAHHFSLLHDDVIDGRVSRGGRPPAWSVFGLRSAILAGDALLATALEALAASGHPCADEGMRVLSAAVLDVVDAQGAGIAFGTTTAVRVPPRTSVAAGKAGVLLGCACALGAIFGGADPVQIDHMRRFGEDLGRAVRRAADDHGIDDRGIDDWATGDRAAPWDLPPREPGRRVATECEAQDLAARALRHLECAGLTGPAAADLRSLARLASVEDA